ncbi:hypothetical protein B14911_10582 [Bacillus sp. NRRL B-14911]|uniref:hypothetical protein n=1 Tax=Bacillus sp. NRRL B-14911 TaxID=313627 RepID=UPI00006B59A4|nr:hypothetical protein [Bacillus sp. NRRL B-14911]EAR66174.1 hypothetical protein B14911_10582 [Bacillus sp. NRRL B-14911]
MEKKKLYELLNDYLEKKIGTETFSNDFTLIYNLHVDYDILSAEENKLFGELSGITSRFSPFEEDLKKYDCYYNENDVERKAKEVFKALS